MKSVIIKATGEALFFLEDNEPAWIGDNGLNGRYRAYDISNDIHEIVTTSAPPNRLPGAYAWNGSVWAVSNQAKVDDYLADELVKAVTFKKSQINAKRIAVETGGITVGGVNVGTKKEDISEITAALSLFSRNPLESTNHKFSTGWEVVSKASLEAMQDAVWAHRKAVAANHRSHDEAIDALILGGATAGDINTYDYSAGWD